MWLWRLMLAAWAQANTKVIFILPPQLVMASAARGDGRVVASLSRGEQRKGKVNHQCNSQSGSFQECVGLSGVPTHLTFEAPVPQNVSVGGPGERWRNEPWADILHLLSTSLVEEFSDFAPQGRIRLSD